MKRVLYLLDYLYSDAGGGTEKQFLLLYQKANVIGIQPYVVFLQDAPVHHKLSWILPPKILNLKKIRSLELLSAVYKLLRYIRDNKIDVIHTMYDDSAIVAAVLSLCSRDLKIIMSLRNMGHEHDARRKKIMSYIFRKSDLVTVNSCAIRDLLVRDYSMKQEHVVVIYNFLKQKESSQINSTEEQDQNFKQLREQHDFVALVISNLRDIKGIQYLIKALKTIVESRDLVIVVLGEGEQRGKYEEMIKEYNLEKRMLLMGYKNNTQQYIDNADLCILASLSEGFSNALIEYAVNKKPIVTTRAGGNIELVNYGEAGVLVEPGDEHALAENIINLLDSPDDMNNIGELAYVHITSLLDENKSINEYKRIYDV